MKLDPFVRQYLETLLWSTTNDDGEPLDRDYSLLDLSPETLQKAKDDCATFCEQIGEVLYSSYTDEELAHNFALTRNHHGAGFWDGDFGDGWDCVVLCAVSQAFNETSLYVGDDGLVYST